ncbi:MAG: SlyX family protein [Pseudomonadota bacterium]
MKQEQVAQQLEAIQTQMAYQEDTISALNDALAGQQQEILTLRRQLELLKQRQDEISIIGTETATNVEQKPPHY